MQDTQTNKIIINEYRNKIVYLQHVTVTTTSKRITCTSQNIIYATLSKVNESNKILFFKNNKERVKMMESKDEIHNNQINISQKSTE